MLKYSDTSCEVYEQKRVAVSIGSMLEENTKEGKVNGNKVKE